jgi:hypothetical protein
MLPQGVVDQRLIAYGAARGTGPFKEMIHQILVQPDGDPCLAMRLLLPRCNTGQNNLPLLCR